MAGHRQGRGALTRAASRAANHRARLAAATTGEAQVAAAFDWARSAAKRHPDREGKLHELATQLATQARQMEGSAA